MPAVPDAFFSFIPDCKRVVTLESTENMTIRSKRAFVLLFSWAAFCGLLGCNAGGDQPELGTVTGTVTLDGKPLSGVIITFSPEVGRPGSATTDSEGKYDLIYRYGVAGTKIGKNTVSFAWPTGAEATASIPEKYGAKSDLTADVKAGKNTFDFALESK